MTESLIFEHNGIKLDNNRRISRKEPTIWKPNKPLLSHSEMREGIKRESLCACIASRRLSPSSWTCTSLSIPWVSLGNKFPVNEKPSCAWDTQDSILLG